MRGRCSRPKVCGVKTSASWSNAHRRAPLDSSMAPPNTMAACDSIRTRHRVPCVTTPPGYCTDFAVNATVSGTGGFASYIPRNVAASGVFDVRKPSAQAGGIV